MRIPGILSTFSTPLMVTHSKLMTGGGRGLWDDGGGKREKSDEDDESLLKESFRCLFGVIKIDVIPEHSHYIIEKQGSSVIKERSGPIIFLPRPQASGVSGRSASPTRIYTQLVTRLEHHEASSSFKSRPERSTPATESPKSECHRSDCGLITTAQHGAGAVAKALQVASYTALDRGDLTAPSCTPPCPRPSAVLARPPQSDPLVPRSSRTRSPPLSRFVHA
jgi:hypothetical protein